MTCRNTIQTRGGEVHVNALAPKLHFGSLLAPQPHDPDAFYWKPNRPTVETQQWEL